MKPYDNYFITLLNGKAAELTVRAMLARIAVRLSSHNIRLNSYIAEVDINGVDILIYLEAPNFTLEILAQVRSRAEGRIPVGRSDENGSYATWAAEADRRRIPTCLFAINSITGAIGFFENRRLRRLTKAGNRSVSAGDRSFTETEEMFTKFLYRITTSPNENAARRAFIDTTPPFSSHQPPAAKRTKK